MYWPVVTLFVAALHTQMVFVDTNKPEGYPTGEACATRLQEMVAFIAENPPPQLKVAGPIAVRAQCVDKNPDPDAAGKPTEEPKKPKGTEI